MVSSNEDNMDKAIDLAIEGRMNPEKFKKVLPQMYSALRADESVARNLVPKIYAVAQSKLLRSPPLMNKMIRFRLPDDQRNHQRDLRFTEIILVIMLDIFSNPFPRSAPYTDRFVTAYRNNIKIKGDRFSINGRSSSNGSSDINRDDSVNRMIREIYYAAYRATAYQFQEEIETTHSMDEIFTRLHDEGELIRDLKAALEECVTLPPGVTTLDELLQETVNYWRAKAVTLIFVNSMNVIRSVSGFYTCLQCWVCQADHSKNCASCNVAAFCGKSCQRVAWKRNHKVLCQHFRWTREHVQAQCQRIAEVHNLGFIPGSTLIPNHCYDHNTVIFSSCLKAGRPFSPLPPSMDSFYENLVTVAKDEQAFQSLFKAEGDESDAESGSYSPDAMRDVCVGLLYSGDPPEQREGRPKVTRNTFLKEYQDLERPRQSEELTMSYVSVALHRLYQKEDYRDFSAERIQTMTNEMEAAYSSPR